MNGIIGAHAILYSRDPEADRAFLRDTLRFPNLDVGGGWLVFALPQAGGVRAPARAAEVEDVRARRSRGGPGAAGSPQGDQATEADGAAALNGRSPASLAAVW